MHEYYLDPLDAFCLVNSPVYYLRQICKFVSELGKAVFLGSIPIGMNLLIVYFLNFHCKYQ